MPSSSRLALAAAALASAGTIACSGTSPAERIQRDLDALVATTHGAYAREHALPDGAGALVHLVTPKGTWTSAAGLPAGAGKDSHYRVASVSKTFTAAAIMLLDQRGLLRIDDAVTQLIPGQEVPYLPDSPSYALPDKERITIAQLLSHRAGVFDVFNDAIPASTAPDRPDYAGQSYIGWVQTHGESDHQFTTDELIGVVARNRLSYFRPGTAYHYSDAGYMLLAKIVERVSGLPYDRFLAESFWEPMGLTATSAPWSAYDTALPQPYLPGVSNFGGGFFETTEDNMSCQVGPGNVVSTPADMARWIRLLLSGKGPLTQAQVARMEAVAPGNATYGLGIGRNALGFGHTGAHPGYVDIVMYHPGDDVAVVVVTPFIDYAGLKSHLALLTELAKRARAAAGYTADWPGIDAGTGAALQDALDRAAAKANVPGATLAVLGPGGVAWSGVTGVSDVPAATPMAPGLIFRVGSVTKTFTAVVILQLVKEGRLALDQPIETILPGAVPGGAAITVRQLLHHTSGLFDYAQEQQPSFLDGLYADRARRFTPAELIAIANAHGPYFPPGSGFHYSNTNYVLLGLAVEAVTGNAFAEEIEARILRPLALHDTSIPSGDAMPPGSTRGYARVNGAWEDVTTFDTSWAGAAGAAVSTSADLLAWADALGRGALLDDQLLAEQQAWIDVATGLPDQGAPLAMGLGLERLLGLAGHTGDFVYGGQAAMYQKDGWRLVALVNASPANEEIVLGSELILLAAAQALALLPP